MTRSAGGAGTDVREGGDGWGNDGGRGGSVVAARQALFAGTVMRGGDREMVALTVLAMLFRIDSEGCRGTGDCYSAGRVDIGVGAGTADLFEVSMIVRRQAPRQTMGGSVPTQEVADEEERSEVAQE